MVMVPHSIMSSLKLLVRMTLVAIPTRGCVRCRMRFERSGARCTEQIRGEASNDCHCNPGHRSEHRHEWVSHRVRQADTVDSRFGGCDQKCYCGTWRRSFLAKPERSWQDTAG